MIVMLHAIEQKINNVVVKRIFKSFNKDLKIQLISVNNKKLTVNSWSC